MKTQRQYLSFTVLLGALAIVLSSCAPPPLEVFLSPNPGTVETEESQTASVQVQPAPGYYQPAVQQSAVVMQTVPTGQGYSGGEDLVLQMNQSLTEAEAHILAGEHRLREYNPLEAIREFERARLLLEQDLDPAVQHLEGQASIQGGVSVLSTSSLQHIKRQRVDLLSRIDKAYDLRAMYQQQQDLDKVRALRQENQSVLKPVNLNQRASSQTTTLRLRDARSSLSPVPAAPAFLLTDLTPEIDQAITRFRQRSAEFRHCLLRANQYFPQVAAILNEEGLPDSLAYVALVESGFQPDARSRDGRVGLWQLSSSIARQYGLNTSSSQDERSYVKQSTRTFARYMRHLYNQFGNWELAVLAYNQGEQAFKTTLERRGIALQHWETGSAERLYLAKIAAAIQIAHNPETYGFHLELPNIANRVPAHAGTTSAFSTRLLQTPPAVTLY